MLARSERLPDCEFRMNVPTDSVLPSLVGVERGYGADTMRWTTLLIDHPWLGLLGATAIAQVWRSTRSRIALATAVLWVAYAGWESSPCGPAGGHDVASELDTRDGLAPC
jgi:hypothetical protein